jgi:hormone-sensitive lipase
VKLLKLAWYGPIYLVSVSRRQAQFKDFVSSGDLSLILKIAKASGNDFTKLFFYFTNPSIKFHQKIYIPHDYDELTTTNLNTALEDFILRNSEDNNEYDDKLYRFTKAKRGAESFNMDLSQLDFNDKKFKFKGKRGMIMLRIVAPFTMNLTQDPSQVKTPPIECDGILIHIHGGGFISQSSSQHQPYLRGWSKELNIPVMMVTYTLSPEAEYPGALND